MLSVWAVFTSLNFCRKLLYRVAERLRRAFELPHRDLNLTAASGVRGQFRHAGGEFGFARLGDLILVFIDIRDTPLFGADRCADDVDLTSQLHQGAVLRVDTRLQLGFPCQQIPILRAELRKVGVVQGIVDLAGPGRVEQGVRFQRRRQAFTVAPLDEIDPLLGFRHGDARVGQLRFEIRQQFGALRAAAFGQQIVGDLEVLQGPLRLGRLNLQLTQPILKPLADDLVRLELGVQRVRNVGIDQRIGDFSRLVCILRLER